MKGSQAIRTPTANTSSPSPSNRGWPSMKVDEIIVAPAKMTVTVFSIFLLVLMGLIQAEKECVFNDECRDDEKCCQDLDLEEFDPGLCKTSCQNGDSQTVRPNCMDDDDCRMIGRSYCCCKKGGEVQGKCYDQANGACQTGEMCTLRYTYLTTNQQAQHF